MFLGGLCSFAKLHWVTLVWWLSHLKPTGKLKQDLQLGSNWIQIHSLILQCDWIRSKRKAVRSTLTRATQACMDLWSLLWCCCRHYSWVRGKNECFYFFITQHNFIVTNFAELERLPSELAQHTCVKKPLLVIIDLSLSHCERRWLV